MASFTTADLDAMKQFALNLTNPSQDVQQHNAVLLAQLAQWPQSVPILLHLLTTPFPISSDSPSNGSSLEMGCAMILKRISDVQQKQQSQLSERNSDMEVVARQAVQYYEGPLLELLLRTVRQSRLNHALSAAVGSLLQWLSMEQWPTWIDRLIHLANEIPHKLTPDAQDGNRRVQEGCDAFLVVSRALVILFENSSGDHTLVNPSCTLRLTDTVGMLLQQFSVLYELSQVSGAAAVSVELLVTILAEVLHMVVAMFQHGVIPPSEHMFSMTSSDEDDHEEDEERIPDADAGEEKKANKFDGMIVGVSPNKALREASRRHRKAKAESFRETQSHVVQFVRIVVTVLSSTMQVGEQLFGSLQCNAQQRLMLVTLELSTCLIAYWSVAAEFCKFATSGVAFGGHRTSRHCVNNRGPTADESCSDRASYRTRTVPRCTCCASTAPCLHHRSPCARQYS